MRRIGCSHGQFAMTEKRAVIVLFTEFKPPLAAAEHHLRAAYGRPRRLGGGCTPQTRLAYLRDNREVDPECIVSFETCTGVLRHHSGPSQVPSS
jgi:hypothetical protein